MWIGASKNSLEKPLGLEWCTEVKTLGIHCSCDQGQIIKQNFHERLSDLHKTINLWNLRGLSLFGYHCKIVPYTKALICFYNTGNSTRNY